MSINIPYKELEILNSDDESEDSKSTVDNHDLLYTAIIPDYYQGYRLDKVLALMFPDYSRSKLKEWLLDETIKINDKISAPNDKVNGNDKVIFKKPSKQISNHLIPQAIGLNIVFADEHIIVINKPPGLIVHPGAGNPDNTLVNALLYYDENLAQLPRAGIIHRLDKDTSGLLLVARTPKAYTSLTSQMQNRDIKRHYIALVYGHIVAGQTINTGYGRDPRNRLKMAVCNSEREAITKYFVNKQYHYATVLNVELFTGRTHQIRVHMTHIKHPIIGDQLYRNKFGLGKNVPENVRNHINSFPRQALHACQLCLTHPLTNDIMCFEAEIPNDFQELLSLMDAEHAKSNS